MKPPAIKLDPENKLERLLHPAHPLCKEDVLWVLEFINKKVAEQDSGLLSLSQPRLLHNFRYFAEVAMMMLHRKHGLMYQESDRLKLLLKEASFGLHLTKP
jgi:hypothetical protein